MRALATALPLLLLACAGATPPAACDAGEAKACERLARQRATGAR